MKLHNYPQSFFFFFNFKFPSTEISNVGFELKFFDTLGGYIANF